MDVIHPLDEGHAIGDLQEEITESRLVQGNGGTIKETTVVKNISSLMK